MTQQSLDSAPITDPHAATVFNRTRRDFPEHLTIAELIQAGTRKDLSHLALVSDHGVPGTTDVLSYGDLNQRANQVAYRLRALGAGPEKVVGIMVERSVAMIVGIFGILKSGAAYLPIYAHDPPERIRYFLEDADLDILLVHSATARKAPSGYEVVDLDDPDLYAGPVDQPPQLAKPENLAYVIYTSGSTGKPKGVMIEHRSVVNRLHWMQRRYPIGPRDVLLQKTPYCFDVSVWEILWWAFEGATLCLLPRGGERFPQSILCAIQQHHVSVLHFVPSMLNVFLQYLDSKPDRVVEALASVRHVFSSGERLSPGHVQLFNAIWGSRTSARLTNLYGPTEATVDVTYFDCPARGEVARVPIGKPIDNIRAYVIREESVMPVGEPGELCLAGVGLARGYLKNPNLTKLRFVESPAVDEERVYRTGDLARWLPDGNIEFLGREDQQVKIRGIRIELGEIEHAVREHPAVADCVVTTKRYAESVILLIAYIVGKDELDLEELRRHLKTRLPDYMIPGHYERIPQIPLTANGKVDRDELPEPVIQDRRSVTMDTEFDVAIVGMACRFPGARNVDEFWQNLAGGVESITRLSDEEILAAGVPAAVLSRPNYVKAAPVLDDPSAFDAAFFGYSPMEARAMDPQQRLLLELAHAALEDAACSPERFPGRIGVFAGAAMNTYFMHNGLTSRFAEDYIPTLILNDKDFLSTRISYKLNLRGPSITVQTACSTSLVAVHLARQSLLSEESDVALAGAVSVRVPHRAGYFCDAGGIVSPDGHVRAFDAGANGTVFGSGGGVVVMKRLADALADGDTIHAILRGSAVNNDGCGKAGYTSPSVDGQADVVVEALANSGVEAESISYIEAHGSGTPVGDPMEVRALTKAFRNFTQRQGFCAIGSVKTNVGHLDAAAGMAGLIKTVLALKHREIPPSLHFDSPNPEIDFTHSPFFVSDRLSQWEGDGALRAGVMSTGMGGTNAYLVLEGASEPAARTTAAPPHLLVLSAKTATALDQSAYDLREFLMQNESVDMGDVAHTLQVGRRAFPFRRSVVCTSREDAVAALAPGGSARVRSDQLAGSTRRPIVFLLPGVGDHYVGMGAGLYDRFEVFKQAVDDCAELLEPALGLDIRKVMYPEGSDRKASGAPRGIDFKRMMGWATEEAADPGAQLLNQVQHCQPALFTVEYALARLWQDWGIQPDRIVGHSLGEYVAACLAGVFSLDDAARLIAERAKLVSALPRGTMLAVLLPEDELRPLLDAGLSISLINGPGLCVVAGPTEQMADFQKRLKERGVLFRQIRNTHAFHSGMIDPIVESFAEQVKRVNLNAPEIPFVSNTTGTWIRSEEAVDPWYWADHARRTARFSDALGEMWKQPDALILEVGPGSTLGVLAMQHPAAPSEQPSRVLASLRNGYDNRSDVEFIYRTLGQLWVEGAEIVWDKLESDADRRRISLPAYPFERKRHWIEPAARRTPAGADGAPAVQKPDLADWFHVPSWERTVFPSDMGNQCGWKEANWLIIANDPELVAGFKATLEGRGATVDVALFGTAYVHRDDGVYEIGAAELDDYVDLIGSLKLGSAGALNVLHLGGLCRRASVLVRGLVGPSQDHGFYSLVNLAKAIGEQDLSIPIRIGFVTSQVHEVTGEETLNPVMATALGACGVMPKEYPHVKSFSVDLPAIPISVGPFDIWVTRLLGEFHSPEPGAVVAYRGQYRWKRTYVTQKLPALRDDTGEGNHRLPGLRDRGVYLITGGTGGIGLVIAKFLAKTCRARLVLLKQSAFPAKSDWRRRLASSSTKDAEARVLQALLEIESLGGEVDVLACDVSDEDGMVNAVQEVLSRHGAIHGVIHSAGLIGVGLIQANDRSAAEQIFSPKVDGSLVLYRALKDVSLDFVVFNSSITSVTTPYGHVDYSAAHAFLDTFAAYWSDHSEVRVLTINWPGWREVGMLANLKVQPGLEKWKKDALRRAIRTEDGLEAFRRALASGLPHLVVSPEGLEDAEPSAELLTRSLPGGARTPVEESRSAVDGPRDEIEQAVHQIWCNVFGISPLGIHDNFADLGGHSLLAMQIVSRIRRTYPITYTLRRFFEYPTIAGTSSAIRAQIAPEFDRSDETEACSTVSRS
nr:putative NRPS/PKS hybrid synthase module E2C [uncultured bacterium]